MELIERFKRKKILVVGDIMLDRYLYGQSTRISPEAPIPVVLITDEKCVLGGAGNVANNLISLGSTCLLISVVGDDEDSQIIETLLTRNTIVPVLFKDSTRPTTKKTRIIAGNNHQLLRLDQEKTSNLSLSIETSLFKAIQIRIKDVDAIILSDYAKGVFSEKLATSIIRLAKEYNVAVTVDTKPGHEEWFKGCTLITPNYKEAADMSGEKQNPIKMGNLLSKKLKCNVFLTRGSEGISYFDKAQNHTHIPPIKITKVFDVTGAGDTVIAVATLGIACGLDFVECAKLANQAAGQVIQEPGTTAIRSEQLKSALQQEISHYLRESIEVKEKVIEKQLSKIGEAAHIFMETYKKGNKVIAFGNGGSASDAQHLVGELVGRFKMERKGLPALALTTDSSVVTAIANDYGYDRVFERQIEANANKGDVVVGISTSGNSPNVIKAIEKAKEIGCKTIGLIGKEGGQLAKMCDLAIVVPSDNTPRIQEAHITIIHIICELLDKEMAKHG